MFYKDRLRGALIGLAVGDALGTTLELTRAEKAPAFPELGTGPHTEITGGGPFDLLPGQVTDDTQMAVTLAMSLVEKGDFDLFDVANRYVSWSTEAFDIGGQTSAALGAVQRGVSPVEAGRHVWLKRGKRPAGNGSLMRTTPIAIKYAKAPERCLEVSLADSSITHFDPRCQLACAAFNASLVGAIHGDDPEALVADALAALECAFEYIQRHDSTFTREARDALAILSEDLEAAQRDDPGLSGDLEVDGPAQGFVRIAFRLAYWELLHAPSFEAALIDVVNRGGDADTNGAITGALLGACYGSRAIPSRWKTTVIHALEDQPPGPWRDAYHPRHFGSLLEHVFHVS